MRLREIAIGLCPPLLVHGLLRISRGHFGWLGDYPSWQSAVLASSGYNSDLILEKVKDSALKVRNGDAVFERDSVIFQEAHYNWPVLAGLLWAASRKGGRLNLLDFGGSLGSSYFQTRKFLDKLGDLRWNVVEQKHFVDCGKEHFENERLRFYHDIESCMRDAKPDTLLLSSVLHYLESPYEMLDRLMKEEFSIIIIGDTPCRKEARDRITVQKVPPSIYPASYPSWVFCERSLVDHLKKSYDLVGGYCNETEYNDKVFLKSFVFEKRVIGGAR